MRNHQKRFNKNATKRVLQKRQYAKSRFSRYFYGTSDEINIKFPFVQKLNAGGYGTSWIELSKCLMTEMIFWTEDRFERLKRI